ncbi:hypothetical protein NSTC745_02687 [Nostoc sp. DSM 114161]|jgi:hypothetical protein
MQSSEYKFSLLVVSVTHIDLESIGENRFLEI